MSAPPAQPRKRRAWTDARSKVIREGRCRACKRPGRLDAAHIIPRSRIPGDAAMDERNVLPLCRACHRKHHDGELELLPLLNRHEQAYIVLLVGIEEARRRTITHAA